MKKIAMMISIITVLAFNQVGVAANEDKTIVKTEKSAVENVTSNATIGFTTETSAPDASYTKPVGRLPTTGETFGIGASLLGLLLIIIVFRKDLKTMVLNKKNIKGEKER